MSSTSRTIRFATVASAIALASLCTAAQAAPPTPGRPAAVPLRYVDFSGMPVGVFSPAGERVHTGILRVRNSGTTTNLWAFTVRADVDFLRPGHEFPDTKESLRLTSRITRGIAPGTSLDVSFAVSVASQRPGTTVRITYLIDSRHEINESNETNNGATESFVVR